ncbi:MG284/MPN403 family protein [Mycoplasma nasistruthionis]|uniref:Uncharacterized protein n=1 Tax=Mycoplasma nasistruthionis TaxID=353852 RepID=A0A4Y6I6S8_9MOLU|nr:hypothetical protein [Mycoplasma nasistruthionis]QCZ36813.1 hypothetical protein FG904_02240 [Mycoplasma nasistruthionis]QDF65092.1 hypothetical protein FIV53_02210 [Mycoplasma nasistruthionis]
MQKQNFIPNITIDYANFQINPELHSSETQEIEAYLKKYKKTPNEIIQKHQNKLAEDIFKLYDLQLMFLKRKIHQLELLVKNKKANSGLKRELDSCKRKLAGEDSLMEKVLDLMGLQHSWLMRKIYLDPSSKQDKFWYTQYFSKTTFYKKKRMAVQEFSKIFLDLV